jgi:hypothetical protein
MTKRNTKVWEAIGLIGIIILCFFIFINSIPEQEAFPASASEDGNANGSRMETKYDGDTDTAYMDYEKDYLLGTDKIVIPFVTDWDERILSYTYTQSGLTVLSTGGDGDKRVYFSLQCDAGYTEDYELHVAFNMTSDVALKADF